MPLSPRVETVNELLKVSRSDTLPNMLVSLGLHVTGKKAFLSCEGIAITPMQQEVEIIDLHGHLVSSSVSNATHHNRILNSLGLQSINVSNVQPSSNKISLIICAARLGLLSRILDISYDHLNQRISFGKKTIKHQLVKSNFSEIYNIRRQILHQLYVRISDSDYEQLEIEHFKITKITTRAEKLMGGHGYILGSIHSISYLSILLYSIFGKISNNKVTSNYIINHF